MHRNYVIDFEFIFQIINELKINGRSVLLNYYTIKIDDEETYMDAVLKAYDDYGENLLCYVTSLSYLFIFLNNIFVYFLIIYLLLRWLNHFHLY